MRIMWLVGAVLFTLAGRARAEEMPAAGARVEVEPSRTTDRSMEGMAIQEP